MKSPKKRKAINAPKPYNDLCLKFGFIKKGRRVIDDPHKTKNIHFQSDWQCSPTNNPMQKGNRILINGALLSFSSRGFMREIRG